MPDLSEQLQRYIDGIASPITIKEAQQVETSAQLPGGSTHNARTRGRWLVGAAAVAALLVLAGVFAAMREDDSDGRLEAGPGTSESAPTTAAGQPEFELLDMREASEAMGSLHSAVDDDELRTLWASIGFDGEPSDVDFARWVVVSITIPDDACPPALAGFERSGSTWTPRFVEPSGGCNQPLIPKTYLVAINRAEVAPSFTLRLPADETFGYDEQLLAIDVPPQDAVAPTTVVSPDSGETVGRVPLPPTGEARSFVLGSGLPIWVVHHPDGSVTAVPGVVPGSDGVHELDGLWSLVRWSPAGTFQGPIAWDAWGRSITDGRDADLSDYVAQIEGQEVVIAVSDQVRVPGEPAVPDGFGGELVEPELPEMADLASGLPEGWSQVDATVVGSGGVSRLCSVDHDVPVGDLATCPPNAPQVEGLTTPQGSTTWSFGPLLVEADGEGRVIHVVAMGGSAGRADR